MALQKKPKKSLQSKVAYDFRNELIDIGQNKKTNRKWARRTIFAIGRFIAIVVTMLFVLLVMTMFGLIG